MEARVTDGIVQRQIEERPSLLEVAIIFIISCAIIIFVFSITGRFFGEENFDQLPTFIKDSYVALWSFVGAAGLAVTGSAIDLAFRKSPRKYNYLFMIFSVIFLIAFLISCLLWFGPVIRQRSSDFAQSVPAGATRIDLSRISTTARSFSLSYLVGINSVGIQLEGNYAIQQDYISGTINVARIIGVNPNVPIPPGVQIDQLVLQICSVGFIAGVPQVIAHPQYPNAEHTLPRPIAFPIAPPYPSLVEGRNFRIDISNVANRKSAWLCAHIRSAAGFWLGVVN
jgi:hypothetical protein